MVAMVCFMGNGWLRVVRDVAGGWFASELAGGFAAMRGSLVTQWVGSAAAVGGGMSLCSMLVSAGLQQ